MRIVHYLHQDKTGYGVVQDDGTVCKLAGSPYRSKRVGEAVGPISSLKLLPPAQPSKIVAVGANYMEHIREGGGTKPAFPLLFLKPPSAAAGHEDDILLPKVEGEIHFEGELVVVIGRTARRVRESEALDYVLGYTCGNDVSARAVQKAEMDTGVLLRGKGFDTFAPMGPCIATGLDPTNLTLESRVNGTVRQHTNTSDLIYSVAALVADMTQCFTLNPGDVIFTGTPSGVGPLKPGDVVEIEIQGVGTLRNRAVADECRSL
ncbi:MAG: fumarylacetoacetate hydrolase family protein [Planctomycetes bacterium]|nr:fumarylacetoacetate hydrolase family protein [Planctomycetota bacterium]